MRLIHNVSPRLAHNISYHITNATVNTDARKTIYGYAKILMIYTRHITHTNLIEQKTLTTPYGSYATETL